MKILSTLLIVLFFSTNMTGCVIVGDSDWHDHDSDWQKRQQANKKVIALLELGETRESIITKMGAPDFSEAFVKNEDNYKILFYRTQHTHSDGETSKDETTPLVFKNESLIGWGIDALTNVKVNPTTID